MKRFIGTLLGTVMAAQVAVAGTMPSIEVSGTGVVISATKVGQIASITTVHAGRVSATNVDATNISGTVADITTLRASTVSTTGAISATGTIYSGDLIIANAGVSTSSIATLNNINGVSVNTSNISFMSGMNQGVSTTSSPTFAGINLTADMTGIGVSLTGTVTATTLRVSDTSYLGTCSNSVTCSSTNDSGRLCFKAVSETYFICDGSGSWAPVQIGTKVSATEF